MKNLLVEQFLKFYENKDHFIDKLPINDELKNKYKSFFKSHSNLENQINWQNKDKEQIIYQIDSLIKNTGLNKNLKDFFDYRSINWKEKGFIFYKEDDNYVYLIPTSYEAAWFADQVECGGQSAKWCIGTTGDSSFWQNYVVRDEESFIMAFKKGNAKWNQRKFMIEIPLEDDDIKYWTQKDDFYEYFNTLSINDFEEDEFEDDDNNSFNHNFSLDKYDFLTIRNKFIEIRKDTLKKEADIIKALPIFNGQLEHKAEEINILETFNVYTRKLFYEASKNVESILIVDPENLVKGIFEKTCFKEVIFNHAVITDSNFFINMFAGSDIEFIDLSRIEFDCSTLMFSYCFSYAFNLKEVKLPSFEGVNVLYMESAFGYCDSLNRIIFNNNTLDLNMLDLTRTFYNAQIQSLNFPIIKINKRLICAYAFCYATIKNGLDLSNLILSENIKIKEKETFRDLKAERKAFFTVNEESEIVEQLRQEFNF